MRQDFPVEPAAHPVRPGVEPPQRSRVEESDFHIREVEVVESAVTLPIVMEREDGDVMMPAECRGYDGQHPLHASYREYTLAEEANPFGFMIHLIMCFVVRICTTCLICIAKIVRRG